jgi:hypothetical protein
MSDFIAALFAAAIAFFLTWRLSGDWIAALNAAALVFMFYLLLLEIRDSRQ